MKENHELDSIRRSALNEVERSERVFKRGIIIVALIEGIFLATFLLVMDFGDRLHWLILIGAYGICYGTLGAGLCTLGAYVKSSEMRLLKSIDLLHAKLNSTDTN